MNRVIFFIILLIVLAIIILLSKINIVIEYKKKSKDDVFVLSFFLYKGLIKYKYKIPSVDPKGKGILYKFRKEKNKKDAQKSKEYIPYSSIIDKIEKAKLFYSKNCSIIKRIRDFLKCKIVLKNLSFNMKLGTGDALQTSILIGISWTFLGIIISFLHQFIKIEKKQIIIKPDYVAKNINLDLYCIFNVRIVYIIVIGFMILTHFIKDRVPLFKAQRCVGG